MMKYCTTKVERDIIKLINPDDGNLDVLVQDGKWWMVFRIIINATKKYYNIK